jgi:rSAM/selenodomain-associated transferase 2
MGAVASFVIPVLYEEAVLGGLLAELRRRYPGCELVVVDGGSSDRTVAVAMPACDHLLVAPAGRAAQMNLGARVSGGDYLFFLHADSLPGLSAIGLGDLLAEAPDWGFCRVRLSGEAVTHRVIAWFMNWRSRLTQVATGDQMLFLRRTLFLETGGFDDIPLMEDVAYCKRLRKLASPRVVSDPVLTSSRRWVEQGTLRTIVRMWLLRLGYFVGVPPATLWRYYYGR